MGNPQLPNKLIQQSTWMSFSLAHGMLWVRMTADLAPIKPATAANPRSPGTAIKMVSMCVYDDDDDERIYFNVA